MKYRVYLLKTVHGVAAQEWPIRELPGESH